MQAGILVLDILAGLVGVIVDAMTGGWYKLRPESLTGGLEPASGTTDLEPIKITLSVEGDQIRIDSSMPGVRVQVAESQQAGQGSRG